MEPVNSPPKTSLKNLCQKLVRLPQSLKSFSGTKSFNRFLVVLLVSLSGSFLAIGALFSGLFDSHGETIETNSTSVNCSNVKTDDPSIFRSMWLDGRMDVRLSLHSYAYPNNLQKTPLPLVGAGPILVAIASPWCIPCQAEIGSLLELAKELPTSRKVKLIIIIDGDPDYRPLRELVQHLFRENEIPPWVEFRSDLSSEWRKTVQARGILGQDYRGTVPAHLVFDKGGNFVIGAGALSPRTPENITILRQAIMCLGNP